MAKILQKIARFSSLMKVLTIISIGSLLLSYLCPYVHPETIWVLPFFGLAYPIIIVVNLFFVVYWALVKSRWFLLVTGFILLGGTLHFRTLAMTFSPVKATETDNVWKILSYNVRVFSRNNKPANGINTRKAIIAYVDKLQPDIICFQEFYQQDKPTNFPTRDTLIGLLGIKDYHERYSHKIQKRQNFGICMLSKYPIIAKGDLMFENSETSDNYCIFADIVKGKDTFRVYNVHLQSIKLKQEDYALFEVENKPQEEKSTFKLIIEKLKIAFPERADQARRVVEHLDSSPYPVIICGDFNDTPMSYVYNQFNKRLIDSFRETSNGLGVTYAGKVPAGRIDYIFHTQNLAAQNFAIQDQVYSDHLAIYCELWKPAPKKD